jgi:hypothetical protein
MLRRRGTCKFAGIERGFILTDSQNGFGVFSRPISRKTRMLFFGLFSCF